MNNKIIRILSILLLSYLVYCCSDAVIEPDPEPTAYQRPDYKYITYSSGEQIRVNLNTDLENESRGRVMYFGDTLSNWNIKLSEDFYLRNLIYDYRFSLYNKYSNANYFAIEPYLIKLIQRIYDFMSLEFKFIYPIEYSLSEKGLISETYRDPIYNMAVGGVEGSQHIIGTAVDVRVNSEEMYYDLYGIITSFPDYILYPNYFYMHGIETSPLHFHVDCGKYLELFRERELFDYEYNDGNINTLETDDATQDDFIDRDIYFVIYTPNELYERKENGNYIIRGKAIREDLEIKINNNEVDIDSDGYFSYVISENTIVNRIISIAYLDNIEVQRIIRYITPENIEENRILIAPPNGTVYSKPTVINNNGNFEVNYVKGDIIKAIISMTGPFHKDDDEYDFKPYPECNQYFWIDNFDIPFDLNLQAYYKRDPAPKGGVVIFILEQIFLYPSMFNNFALEYTQNNWPDSLTSKTLGRVWNRVYLRDDTSSYWIEFPQHEVWYRNFDLTNDEMMVGSYDIRYGVNCLEIDGPYAEERYIRLSQMNDNVITKNYDHEIRIINAVLEYRRNTVKSSDNWLEWVALSPSNVKAYDPSITAGEDDTVYIVWIEEMVDSYVVGIKLDNTLY
ncbi:MAG: hypothetical protein JXB88_25500 [Spirochaetales bacterium]|nr:hypothetical protein [Spirochaetales bacterium]